MYFVDPWAQPCTKTQVRISFLVTKTQVLGVCLKVVGSSIFSERCLKCDWLVLFLPSGIKNMVWPICLFVFLPFMFFFG